MFLYRKKRPIETVVQHNASRILNALRSKPVVKLEQRNVLRPDRGRVEVRRTPWRGEPRHQCLMFDHLQPIAYLWQIRGQQGGKLRYRHRKY